MAVPTVGLKKINLTRDPRGLVKTDGKKSEVGKAFPKWKTEQDRLIREFNPNLHGGAHVVPCGEVNGRLVVLDLDPVPGTLPDFDAVREFRAAFGLLPPTYVVRTGRGGYHLYYRAVGGRCPGTRKDVRKGKCPGGFKQLDVRGEGGCAFGAGTQWKNTRPYEVITGSERTIAEVPTWRLAWAAEQIPGHVGNFLDGKIDPHDKTTWPPFVREELWLWMEAGRALYALGYSEGEIVEAMSHCIGFKRAECVRQVKYWYPRGFESPNRSFEKTAPQPRPPAVNVGAALTGAGTAAARPNPVEWAQRAVEESTYVYSVPEERLYAWDGKKWNRNGTKHLEIYITENFVEELGCAPTRTFIDKVSRVVNVKTKAYDPEWNTYPFYYIPLLNGMYDAKNGAILPHDPKYRNRYVIKRNFDPNAKCPTFEKFLESCSLSDRDLRNLQKFAGYSLLRSTEAQVMLLIVGPSRTGKSTFLHVLVKVMGLELTNKMRANKLQTRFGTGQTHDKLLTYYPELSSTTMEYLEELRDIVSEAFIDAELKFENSVHAENITHLILAANQLPSFPHNTNPDSIMAFFRRVLLVKFEKIVEKPDKYLARKIVENEADGVLNWMLEGAKMYLEEGFEPNPVEELMHSWNEYGGGVERFFVAVYEITKNPKDAVPTAEMYEDYKVYCREEGMKVVPQREFNRRIEAFGAVKKQKKIDGANRKCFIYVRKKERNSRGIENFAD